jgi:rare lipoprotein A
MLLKIKPTILTAAFSLALGGCGAGGGANDLGRFPPPPSQAERGQPDHAPLSGGLVQDYPVKIGNPYQVGNITYTPSAAMGYDDVGYASWYGEESGQTTANGEAFIPRAVSAAHKTLPLPSYVEVTALNTGRTILVRVNDRGPFVNDRIIDLSRGAAEQLGIMGQGAAPVRVRRVSPPEQERATLRSGNQAAERIATPEPLLVVLRNRLAEKTGGVRAPATPLPRTYSPSSSGNAPAAVPRSQPQPQPKAPQQPAPPANLNDPFVIEQAGAPRAIPSVPSHPATSAPPHMSGGYVVQVGAFSSREGAIATAQRIGANVVQTGNLWRVRYGPYSSEAAAQQGLQRANAAGFNGARIMLNDR